MITEVFVQKFVKNGLLTCTFHPPNENLAPSPMGMMDNKLATGDIWHVTKTGAKSHKRQY